MGASMANPHPSPSPSPSPNPHPHPNPNPHPPSTQVGASMADPANAFSGGAYFLGKACPLPIPPYTSIYLPIPP